MPQSRSFDPDLLALAAARTIGAVTTIKRDGRPQLSMVNLHVAPDGPHGTEVRASVTDGRAKVANLRRDPRVSVLVTASGGTSYAVLEGDASFSPVAQAVDDATTDELVELYRTIRGVEHPDWDDYRRAMVADRRLVLRVAVTRVYGLIQ
jgi:PPOX class probable F420-dependent enzyme